MRGTADTGSTVLDRVIPGTIFRMEENARGMSKEIYCRDKRVQRKMRVKAGSVVYASGNAGSDAKYSCQIL